MYVCARGLVLLSLSVVLVTVEAATSQNEINRIASTLKIQVDLGTRHIAGNTYDVSLRLTNTGNQKILSQKDWQIQFSLKGHNLLSKATFESPNGLKITSKDGCAYVIQPVSTNKNSFKGLTNGKTAVIDFTAKGLSVFKYDIFPRFFITAPGRTAKNIVSTDDDRLGFVHLAGANSSEMDLSRMTGPRRSLTQPDMFDRGRVPISIVVPSPKSIASPNSQWIDLSASQKWYIWPSNLVSQTFLDLFIEKLSTLPNVTASMFQVISADPGANTDKIYLQLADVPGRSQDGYTLAVQPRTTGGNFLHISASSEIGLNNALESLLAVTGLFNIAPALTIQDDARFGKRSVLLDVTKNFMPASVVKKFIRLMKMYKLNNLVLNLADDYGWRLEMPATMDFPELTTYAGRRCADKSQCLNPEFGSGADSSTSGSGFYTTAEFEDLVQYAWNRTITITPKFNFLGGIRSAKKASHIRYERLIKTNTTEANRLHLMTQEPTIHVDLTRDNCYIDGVLDPCDSATRTFFEEVITAVQAMYHTAKVQFAEFHAGGDENTKLFGEFPSCKSTGVTQAQAQKKMLTELDNAVRGFNAKLRVREEVVIDPDTKSCLQRAGTYNYDNLIVDFWNISPGNQKDWGLSQEELDYINGPIEPRMSNDSLDDAMQGFMYKRQRAGLPPLKTPWQKKGLAPWAKAYHCANSGYKVILGPEAFFSLDSAYELDFDEMGNRKKDRVYIINLHRMMTFEPLNFHTNADTGNDGPRYLPYRLCHIYECETLTAKQNVLGLQALIDTETIRTEAALWEAVLPGLLLFAEKAWREAPFENILKAEEPRTLTVGPLIDERTFFLNQEIRNFTNNFGYKESGRLDYHGFSYRVPRPGALVNFMLPTQGYRGPYPVIVKVDIPGAEIEYRELHVSNSPWKPLFSRDMNLGVMVGGYNFTFPVSNQRIEIRTKSTDGTRSSPAILIRGGTKDLWPREIPIELREGTCLPIRNASITELNDVTVSQWNRVLDNVGSAQSREQQFDIDREGNITQSYLEHRRRFPAERRPLVLVVETVQVLMARGYNMSSLNDSDVVKTIYNVERRMSQTLIDELDGWEEAYQRCKNGKPPSTGQTGQGQGGSGNNRGRGAGQTAPGRGNARGRSGQAGGGNNRQLPGQRGQGTANRQMPRQQGQGAGNSNRQIPGQMGQGMANRQVPRQRGQGAGNVNRQMQGQRGQGARNSNRQMGGRSGQMQG